MKKGKTEKGTVSNNLLRSAACSRRFLESDSRYKIGRFMLDRQNPDGGFRGRSTESDLYYTVFALASLRALDEPIPFWKVWKYVRSFGLGDQLDLVHLVCLIRLRTAFPILKVTRRRLLQRLEKHDTNSSYDLFLKLLGEDYLETAEYPDAPLLTKPTDPTTNLAAAVLINRQNNAEVTAALLSRAAESGGFSPTDKITEPDLLSTATALFALTQVGANLDGLQEPCIKYVESLWRDSGGFSGHVADEFEDAEYTFYALLSIGCLIQSLASNYGN